MWHFVLLLGSKDDIDQIFRVVGKKVNSRDPKGQLF